jgi:hypothetical protein
LLRKILFPNSIYTTLEYREVEKKEQKSQIDKTNNGIVRIITEQKTKPQKEKWNQAFSNASA